MFLNVAKMKKYLAEFIGTFTLVFCGTGAIIVNKETGGVVSHVGIAMTFGLVVMAMIYSIGHISGAHMNPAVSIAFWAGGLFPARQILPYIASQCSGALLASVTLKLLFPLNATLGATLPAGSELQSFVLEFILAFFLMFVIMQVAKSGKEQGLFAGLAIGFTVLLEALFAGPISGASMNPARSVAPALISGHTIHLWIYLTAPVAGALMAVLITQLLKPGKTNFD